VTWRPVPRGDRWIAGGFVLAAAIEPWIRGEAASWALAADTAGAVTFALLVLRRVRPLLMVTALCLLALLGTTGQALFAPSGARDSAVGVVALLVASYSLGAYASRRQLLLGAPQPLLLIVCIDLIEPGTESLASAVPFAALFVVLVPVLAGRLLRARARLVDRLDAQAAELEAHRDDQVQVALATERVRLAEDLHARLLAGMEDLARQISAVDVDGPAPAEAVDVAAIESAARELLGATRTAVVRLAGPVSPDGAVALPPGTTPPVRDLRPWTALAGAALGAGLLLELSSMSLLVAAPVAVLGCALMALPLAFAWAAPVTMTVVLWCAAAGFDHLVAPLDASFTAIGLAFAPPFLVAALARRPRAVTGLGVCVLGEATCFGVPALADHAVILVLAWVAGLVLHERGRLADRLHTNTALLCEQRDAAARRVVLEERARLARELHDALGHSLTVVVLQAEAARRLWATEQDRAAALLAVIAATTQDGLESLRSGLLPGAAPGALLTSTALAGLFDRARAAGITVEASIDDLADLLGPEAEVAVYRVLQEALTNVLKHAPGARASVVVRRTSGGAELSVSSSGGRPATAAGSGRGLLGMQARVLALGGQLDWSRWPDGTFRVRASVPAAARDVVPA
jgi:signal transduction histidine kinase